MGRITITSKERTGKAKSERDAILSIGKTAMTGTGTMPRTDQLTKSRLLLAEDNQVAKQILGLMLERENYELDFAENGQEVIEMWERNGYDLILMDVQMPLVDGFEATVAIREKERTRGGHTPIIAMTAHAHHEDEERCLAAGMDAYLSKPIDFEKTLHLIEKILKQKPASALPQTQESC